MRTLLIVDDEKAARKGISVMVERIATQFADIREASDGIEALEWLKGNKADLMFVDMKMPNMDGIALLKNVVKMPKPPKCVVLSGYGEFSYASESMKYGAVAYLLKPVHREELTDLLFKIEKILDDEEEYSNIVAKANNARNKLVSEEIISLFKNDKGFDEVSRILHENKVEILNDSFSVAVYSKNIIDTDTLDKIGEKVKTAISERITDARVWSSEDEIIVACRQAESLVMLLKICGGTWGVSKECFGISNLHISYLQATEALKYRIFNAYNNIIMYKQIENLPRHNAIQKENIQKVLNLLYTDRIQALKNIFHDVFNTEKFINSNILYLEETIKHLEKDIFEYLYNNLPQLYAFIGGRVEKLLNLSNYSDIYQYVSELKDVLIEVNRYVLSHSSLVQNDNIDSALVYIHNNYEKDINMATVSNQMCMNYSYFSKEFKEKTGVNFSDYLRNYRIEKAKSLLVSTQLKIIDISVRVGYQDAKNFATAFRSVCGITPKEYRSICRKYFLAK